MPPKITNLSFGKLVPDVVFQAGLCFAQERNVWATRRIITSRVTCVQSTPAQSFTDMVLDGLVQKTWRVDGKKRCIRQWYVSGQMHMEEWWDISNETYNRGRGQLWLGDGQLHHSYFVCDNPISYQFPLRIPGMTAGSAGAEL